MYRIRNDAALVDYRLATEDGEVPSKMPSAVAEEILNRVPPRKEDGVLATGRMRFSAQDFKEL